MTINWYALAIGPKEILLRYRRDGMGREMGGGFRTGNTCIPVADSWQCMAKAPQYCKGISIQLK